MADLIAPECFDAILFVEKYTAPHKHLRFVPACGQARQKEEPHLAGGIGVYL